MGGGKSKAAKFSDADQLKIQQQMVNAHLQSQEVATKRPAIETIISQMPKITDLGGLAAEYEAAKQTMPPAPGVQSVDLSVKPLSDLPTLNHKGSAGVKSAPGVSKATKAPGVKAMPDLYSPSDMPVRDAGTLLAAKKEAVKAAQARGGRASTILTSGY